MLKGFMDKFKEAEECQYLLNVDTKVISKEGDVVGDKYLCVIAEEIETANGFKLVGITEKGKEVEAFLTFEEYFNGKEFVVKNK